MNDVAVVEWRVLPAEKPRVVLIDKQCEVRTKFAAFVAKTLGERWMRTHEAGQRLTYGPGLERHLTRAAGEAAVGAVQQHPHAGTTIRRRRFRHPLHVSPTRISTAGTARSSTPPTVPGAPSSSSTDRYRGVVALRPAIVNWRTTEADVDLLVDVVRELGTRLGAAAAV